MQFDLDSVCTFLIKIYWRTINHPRMDVIFQSLAGLIPDDKNGRLLEWKMPSLSTVESPPPSGWPHFEAIEVDLQDPRIARVFELRQLHGVDVQDGTDASSMHFLALANVQVVGCARLTPPSATGLFPHQADHGVKLYSASMADSPSSHPALWLELGALVFTQAVGSPAGIFGKDDANPDHGIISVMGRRLATRQILMQLCQAMFGKSLSSGTRYWISVLPPYWFMPSTKWVFSSSRLVQHSEIRGIQVMLLPIKWTCFMCSK